ncbi:hypothetical protein CCR82_17640 [Halochromatium salexigens]|uniref:Uncharacterized protein n=1 Tax=Halochromatium salexigens TaxID=49447 RepID=A0AAJ0ULU2_HALSE|nr:hypothetical protein [Halochromatium salexigens]
MCEPALDLCRLRRDNAQATRGGWRLELQRVQDLATGHDRREWIAQLIAQRCQELVALGDMLGTLAQEISRSYTCRLIDESFGIA